MFTSTMQPDEDTSVRQRLYEASQTLDDEARTQPAVLFGISDRASAGSGATEDPTRRPPFG